MMYWKKEQIMLFVFVFTIHLSSSCYGQQILLNGQVSIHNSKYKTGEIQYVENAQLIADFTTPTTTDFQGNFTLTFVGLDSGTAVDVNMEKSGWEVVNKRDLQEVIIGRRTPLKVFLARKGALAQAQAELYNVSIKALTKRHDQRIRQLRIDGSRSQEIIKDLERQYNITITNRQEAEALMKEQLSAAKKRVPEFAKNLAATNLDFATDMYRTAYEFFKKGEIGKAIETLDEAILDQQATEAVNNLDTLKAGISLLDSAKMIEQNTFNQHIESMLLKAKAQTQQAQYQNAIDNYQQILSKLGTVQDSNQVRLAQIYWDLSNNHQKSNDIQNELKFRLHHLQIIEQLKETKALDLVNCYQDICQLYRVEHKLDEGIFYQEKALDISLRIHDIDHPDVLKMQAVLVALLEQHGQELLLQQQYKEALIRYERLSQLRPKDKTFKKTIRQLKK